MDKTLDYYMSLPYRIEIVEEDEPEEESGESEWNFIE